MNPKTQRELFESVNSIVFPKLEESVVKEDNIENIQEEIISTFLQNSLQINLNESSNEEVEKSILEAVQRLNLLTHMVNEYFGFEQD